MNPGGFRKMHAKCDVIFSEELQIDQLVHQSLMVREGTAKLVLPPFLFTPRISFGQSQTTQNLTKFILKNTNIYNT